MLLANQNFLPESGVSLISAQVDLSMMMMFSSLERTQKHWLELLNTAGFDLIKVLKEQINWGIWLLLFLGA